MIYSEIIIGVIAAIALLGALVSFIVAAKLTIDSYKENIGTSRHVHKIMTQYSNLLVNTMSIVDRCKASEDNLNNSAEVFNKLNAELSAAFKQVAADFETIREEFNAVNTRLDKLEKGRDNHFEVN